MTTFARLIANVKRDLRATEGSRLSDEDVRDAINDAITEYEHERFKFNEGSTSLNLVAAQQSYDLPAGLLEVDEIQYDHASRKYRLDRINFRDFTKLSFSSVATVGPSYVYAIHSEQLHFYPIPHSPDTLQIFGIYRVDPSPLDDPLTSNGWTTAAHRLIRARACWDLSLMRLHNPDLASNYEAAVSSSLSHLRDSTRQLIATGQSHVDDWDYC